MPRSFLTTLLAICCLVVPHEVYGQEFDVNVTVDMAQIDNASLNFLDQLPAEIESYFNEHDWIDARFEEQERIQAEFQIVFTGADNNFNFQADVVIRSLRPIYHSVQNSTVLLFNDDSWSFNYTPNRALIHDELQFDALTTLLDFYAYVMLGFDFDSFSELGGTPYFTEARNLVALAQTTSASGWSRTSGTRRNRAQLVADLLNPGYEGLRKAIYRYHRLGLDRFTSDPEEARTQILESLEMIREARRTATNDFLFDTFFNAKYREIVSVFEDAPAEMRLEVYNLLTEIDQSHLGEYSKLQ